MIGQIVEMFDDERRVIITDKEYYWTSVMDDDFARIPPGIFVDFIQVDGYITRIEPTIDPENRLANLTGDQRKQLAIILQSSVKVVSDQVAYVGGGTVEGNLKVIKEEAYQLMLFIDSKTTRFLS
jgi:hypothetical protein